MKEKDFFERIFQDLSFSCTLAATWVIKEKKGFERKTYFERELFLFLRCTDPGKLIIKGKKFIVGHPVQRQGKSFLSL